MYISLLPGLLAEAVPDDVDSLAEVIFLDHRFGPYDGKKLVLGHKRPGVSDEMDKGPERFFRKGTGGTSVEALESAFPDVKAKLAEFV
jgi:hypothetical protein